MTRLLTAFALGVGVLLFGTLTSAQDKKEEKKDKDAPKTGKAIGILIAKDKTFIELKADGEEKARRYVPQWVGGAPANGGGFDKKTLKTFSELKIGSRIEVEWLFEERLRAMHIKVLKAPHDSEKKEEASNEPKRGKTVGVVVGKGDKFIELRGDGEERGRKYYARYLSGPPAGFDKEILRQFDKLAVGSRIQAEWVSTNHGPQIHKIEVLKAAGESK